MHVGEPDEHWYFYTGRGRPVGNLNGDTYGLVSLKGKLRAAHRWVYEYFNGPIPPGMVVRHTCDVFRCCNPRHLILGTRAENMRDAVERGRIPRGKQSTFARHPEIVPRGESHARSKLTTADIFTIQLLFYSGLGSAPRLARTFEVNEAQINFIVQRRTWRHVTNWFRITPAKHRRVMSYYRRISCSKRKPKARKVTKEIEQFIIEKSRQGWSGLKIAKYLKLNASHVCKHVRRLKAVE